MLILAKASVSNNHLLKEASKRFKAYYQRVDYQQNDIKQSFVLYYVGCESIKYLFTSVLATGGMARQTGFYAR